MNIARAISLLPGFRVLSGVGGSCLPHIPNAAYKEWLLQWNGAIAFQGALRFFPAQPSHGLVSLSDWNSNAIWKYAFGRLSPTDTLFFAEDAFGVQFGFSREGDLVRFWNETGQFDSLGMDIDGFVEAIRHDPAGTISFDLYQSAQKALGPLSLTDHFAFRVETALGGPLDISNLSRMNSIEHMRACGSIAQQITDLPMGTPISKLVHE